MSLASMAVRRKTTFLMLFLLMAGVGILAVTHLGIDYFPKVDLGKIVVLTMLPGAGPSEMEGLTTEVIEDAVSGIEGVETITSESRNGISIVTLELTDSADIDRVETDIRDAVAGVRGQMPDAAADSYVFALESAMKPLILLTFTSDVMNAADLRQLVEDEITPRLGRVEGVSSAEVSGGQIRQINVVVDPTLLSKRGIPIAEVHAALRAVRGNQPGGDIEDGNQELAISVKSGFKNLDSIRGLVIGVHQGQHVRIADVAEVVDGFRESRNYIYLNQGETVLATFMMSPDANTVNTCRRLAAAIAEIAEEYSGVLNATIIYNQERFITGSMRDLLITAVQAVLLAAAVLTFFLGSLSNAGIVSLSMPLSFIASFAAMHLLGVTLNIMSLAGLSISIGMIVDNSVVVLENIHRRKKEGETIGEASVKGAAQVGKAVAASTFTTVAVFIPMLFIRGMTGQIFRDLSITISSALVISLFISQSLIPLLASRSGKLVRRCKPRSITGHIQAWLERLEERYARNIKWLIGHVYFALVPVILLLLLSLFMLRFIPKTHLPKPQEGMLQIELKLAPGTGLEFTDSLLARVESAVLEVIEPGDLENSLLSIGRQEGIGAVFGASSSNHGTLNIYFTPEGVREKSIEEYDFLIRGTLDRFPGIRYELTGGMSIGTDFPVNIIIYGTDLNKLREIGCKVRRNMSRIPGTVDVFSSLDSRIMQIDFTPSEEMLFMKGMSPERLGTEMTIGIPGSNATLFIEDDRQFDVNLRYAEFYRSTAEFVSGLVAFGMPLDAWGNFHGTLAPEAITRRDRIRSVSVTCGISRRALGDVARDVETMMDTLDIGNHRYEILGDVKDREEAFGNMALAILAAVILVYMVMASQFESLLEPFIIIIEIPLALIGVIWTLFLTGTTIDLTALIGLLALAGIVVNNGIVLIDFANQLRRESGMSAAEAIVLAGRSRLRPILMTAVTTILALLPLAIGGTESSVMWTPMARVVAGGLFSATFLTLVVLPCLYVKLDHLKNGKAGNRETA